MISLKYLNRFLVAGFLLAGQTLSMQAGFQQKDIIAEVDRINNGGEPSYILYVNKCGITDDNQWRLIPLLKKIHDEKRDKIKIIRLCENAIKNIPFGVLDLFPNVECVELNHNKLNLSSNMLNPSKKFLKITTIDIAQNGLQLIDKEFFDIFPNLLHIDIHSNGELKIPLQTLKLLLNVKKVRLDNTPLERDFQALIMNGLKPEKAQDQIILNCLKKFEGKYISSQTSIDIPTLATKFYMPYQTEVNQLKLQLEQKQSEIDELIRTLSEYGAQ